VDSDLGLNMLWSVDSNGLYSARWEVPLDAPTGTYRFVVSANRYRLASSSFRVVRANSLAAVPVNAPAGHVAVTLHYPQPTVHEAVGDPPGDLSADLTFRPETASSGRATFLVNGRPVTATAGSGGVFEVAAPAGTQVEVKPGAVTDSHGNSNANTLTLAP
jgi:hypothetical protein